MSINETYEGNEVVRPQYAAAIKKRTIWVNDRKDVEIVIVNKALDLCRIAILRQETIGEVFVNLGIRGQTLLADTSVGYTHHSRDPFAGMDGTVPDDRWLAA